VGGPSIRDEEPKYGLAAGVHAMTDVTGFGLLGHLHNMCRASGLAAELDARAVPMIDGARELLHTDQGVYSGTIRNLEWADRFAHFDDGSKVSFVYGDICLYSGSPYTWL
jgi:selenide, water dikinase